MDTKMAAPEAARAGAPRAAAEGAKNKGPRCAFSVYELEDIVKEVQEFYHALVTEPRTIAMLDTEHIYSQYGVDVSYYELYPRCIGKEIAKFFLLKIIDDYIYSDAIKLWKLIRSWRFKKVLWILGEPAKRIQLRRYYRRYGNEYIYEWESLYVCKDSYLMVVKIERVKQRKETVVLKTRYKIKTKSEVNIKEVLTEALEDGIISKKDIKILIDFLSLGRLEHLINMS